MANILKRSLNLFLCLALVLSMMSAVTLTAAAESTTELLLNKTYAKLKVNENETLDLKAVLKNGDTYSVADVTWKSTEEGVATVSNGTVTPVAEGTTLITATTADGIVAKCTVDVYDSRLYFEERWVHFEAKGSIIKLPALNGNLNESATVTYTAVNNAGADFVTIEDGVYTATTEGLIEFKATASAGNESVSTTCYVTIGNYGLSALASIHMAIKTGTTNQYIWQMGYMTEDGFVLYDKLTIGNRNANIYNESDFAGKGFINLNGFKWHPGDDSASVLVWQAHKSGTITVGAGVAYNRYLMNAGTESKSGTERNAGKVTVKLSVLHNNTTKFEQTYESMETETPGVYYFETSVNGTGTSTTTRYFTENSFDTQLKNALTDINVSKGDKLYFVLENMGGEPTLTMNQSYFNVTYTNTQAETETTFGINENAMSLMQGEAQELNGEGIASYATSNANIATVSENGTVTAVGEGEAVIYALNSAGTLADYCTVEVTGKKVLLNKSYAKLEMNDTLKLNAVWNDLSDSASVTWSSTEKGVATVNSNGVVTPVSAGTTLIKATLADGTVAKCTVDVYDERLYFDDMYDSIAKGDTYSPVSKLRGAYAEVATISYLGGRNDANDAMSKEPMSYDSANNNYSADNAGLAKFTATANVNGETVTAVKYVAIDAYGPDLVNTLQLAKQGTAAERTSNQYLWKMGYIDNGEFVPYTDYNESMVGFNVINQTNQKGGVFLKRTVNHVWTAGSDNASAIVWKAPMTGTVTISRGTAYAARIRTRTETISAEEYTANLKVSHDGTTLYDRTFTGDANTASTVITDIINREMGYTNYPGIVDTLKNLSVKKGDEIYFVLTADNASLQLNQSYFSVTYTATQNETETTFGIADEEIVVAENGTKTLTAIGCAEFVSSNETVATVDNSGNIVAKSEGTAVIYAINADGTLADACTVVVGDWGTPTLDGNTVTIEATTANAKSAAVIVAVKDNEGIFKNAYIAELVNNIFTANNVLVESGDSVTVFLWESLTTLKPLKAAIPVATK